MSKDLMSVFIPAPVKLAMREAGAGSSDLWKVPLANLRPIDGFNVRVKDDSLTQHIHNLSESILANGFDQAKPLTGYAVKDGDKSYIAIVDGYNRFEATHLAIQKGALIESLPVVVKSGSTSLEDLTVGLVTSNGGKPLTPFETALVCKRLEGYGWDAEKIAKRLVFTITYANDLLYLMSCPKGVRDLVQNGKVSAANAIGAVRKHGADALDVLKGAITVAEKKGKSKATAKDMEPTFKAEIKKRAGELYECLKWVQEDRSFLKLTESTQTLLNELISSLPEEPQKK